MNAAPVVAAMFAGFCAANCMWSTLHAVHERSDGMGILAVFSGIAAWVGTIIAVATSIHLAP
jgi:hypothetical protein